MVTREATPDGVVTETEYNDDGFAVLTRRGTMVTGFGYKSDPNSFAHLLGQPTEITLPHGSPVTVSYDNRLLPVKTARGAQVSETGYDENGNPILIERAVDEGSVYRETRRYNQVNFLEETKLVNVDLGGGATADLITAFTPDAVFRPEKITYPGGESRTLKYDQRGNIVEDAIGTYIQTFRYDRNGNLLRTDAREFEVSEVAYDGQDRPIVSRSFSDNGTPSEQTNISYFAGGETRRTTVTSVVFGSTQRDVEVTEIDALGRSKAITFHGTDVSGNQTIVYTPGESGGLTTTVTGPRDTISTVTDSAGRTVSRTSATGTTTIEYAQKTGNPTKVTSLENGNTYSLAMDYNSLDHQTSLTDSIGVLWQNGLHRLDGLLKSRTNGRGAVTTMAYSRTGNLLEFNRPERLTTRTGFNRNLQAAFVADRTDNGHRMEYTDGTRRLTKKTLRNGGEISFTQPDEGNNPTEIKLPGGGNSKLSYDPQSRPVQHVAEFEGTYYMLVNGSFDALGRLVFGRYGDSATASNEFRFTYDPLGPLTKASYQEDGRSLEVQSTLRNDGARTRVTYADGTKVDEGRDSAGRLTSVTADSVIFSVESFAGATMPKVISHGGGFSETNSYDGRRRLTSRRYTRDGDGKVLADMRFEYDASDNLITRQFVHRSGRADFFSYDFADRLTSAAYGLRPVASGAQDQTFPGFPTGGTGLKPGLFFTNIAYDAGGLDLLQSATLSNPRGFPSSPGSGYDVPPFAAALSATDSFLFAKSVDGTDRGAPDPLGNATKTVLFTRSAGQSVPQRRMATSMKHNGMGHMVELVRDDGVSISCQYQPSGLMRRRKVTSGSATVSDTAFVWDNGRLIEERDVGATTSTVRARYYYDDGDAPVAADIRSAAGTVERFHFLRSHDSSVIGVTNASGTVVERVHYSAHGMPVIELQDSAPPRIAQVEVENATSVLVHFSEPVLTRLSSVSAPALVTTAGSFNSIFSVDGSAAASTWLEAAPGRPFGAVVRVNIGTLNGAGTLQLKPAAVFDEWGNANAGEAIVISSGGASGSVLFPAPGVTIPDTAPVRAARSAIGNPFLFHGQYFDYDSGLLYLRARWYDPFTGTFLERDPREFRDSVNLYAGMGNNPVSFRDPSGRGREKVFEVIIEYGRNVLKLANKGPFNKSVVDLGRRSANSDIASLLTREVTRALQNTGRRDFIRDIHPDAKDLLDRSPDMMRRMLEIATENLRANRVEVYSEAILSQAEAMGVHKLTSGENPVSVIALRKGLSEESMIEALIHELGGHSNLSITGRFLSAYGRDTAIHEFYAYRIQAAYGLLGNVTSPGGISDFTYQFMTKGNKAIFEHMIEGYGESGVTRELIEADGDEILTQAIRSERYLRKL